jgi:hypothetical protein
MSSVGMHTGITTDIHIPLPSPPSLKRTYQQSAFAITSLMWLLKTGWSAHLPDKTDAPATLVAVVAGPLSMLNASIPCELCCRPGAISNGATPLISLAWH